MIKIINIQRDCYECGKWFDSNKQILVNHNAFCSTKCVNKYLLENTK